MPYLTIPIRPKDRQLSFDDIMNGVKDLFDQDMRHTNDTRTVLRDIIPDELIKRYNVHSMLFALNEFNDRYKDLIAMENKKPLYHRFYQVKPSGGLRPIDAPNEELKKAQDDLKYLFEYKFCASYHTASFAYIKGRSTRDAVARHQQHNSNWFLKLDFSNFFGSSTPKFILDMLGRVFPFCSLFELEGGKEAFSRAMSLCFLNGGLPQGTPISSLLTNVMMIPLDHYIAKVMRESTLRYCYTRYADDLIISSEFDFRWSEVQQQVIDILKKFGAPFSINKEKTHYGSRAGRNWILGLMLNKDNQITIGHQKKKTFKAMLFSILSDYKRGVLWTIEDAQVLRGLISYYIMIEKVNIQKIINDYNKKFGLNVYGVIKNTLKQIVPPKSEAA